jgi:hypothetical protein
LPADGFEPNESYSRRATPGPHGDEASGFLAVLIAESCSFARERAGNQQMLQIVYIRKIGRLVR